MIPNNNNNKWIRSLNLSNHRKRAPGMSPADFLPSRIEFYHDIIKDNVKDKTVTVVGAGTGIMAVLAAQYGAKKVYAIENDPRTYKILEHLIYKSSYDHIITCVEDTFCMSTSVYNNADVFIQYMTNSEPKLDVKIAFDAPIKPSQTVLPNLYGKRIHIYEISVATKDNLQLEQNLINNFFEFTIPLDEKFKDELASIENTYFRVDPRKTGPSTDFDYIDFKQFHISHDIANESVTEDLNNKNFILHNEDIDILLPAMCHPDNFRYISLQPFNAHDDYVWYEDNIYQWYLLDNSFTSMHLDKDTGFIRFE